ncbi:MAG TPA: prepilin peptidase [Jatrophihabitantaceae bacterium]|jgi:leader peptidase (prepilin peptidase)/N-methyltransferase
MAHPSRLTVPTPGAQLTVAAASLAVSPILASWTQRLIDDERHHWWYPRRVRPERWLAVTMVATGLALLGARGTPAFLWWLLATCGTVLALVDAQTYRLPARLVGPLAMTGAITLAVTAAVYDEPHRLLRAALAAALIATIWLVVALISPSAMGMGDVYLAGITAGALGWAGWPEVILGQLAAWLFAPLVMAAVAIGRPDNRGLRMRVPMGPALLAGAISVCLL